MWKQTPETGKNVSVFFFVCRKFRNGNGTKIISTQRNEENAQLNLESPAFFFTHILEYRLTYQIPTIYRKLSMLVSFYSARMYLSERIDILRWQSHIMSFFDVFHVHRSCLKRARIFEEKQSKTRPRNEMIKCSYGIESTKESNYAYAPNAAMFC